MHSQHLQAAWNQANDLVLKKKSRCFLALVAQEGKLSKGDNNWEVGGGEWGIGLKK